MAPQVGLEPTTDRLTADSSTTELLWNNKMERVMGIEPTTSAWKAEVLPLNYTRILRYGRLMGIEPTNVGTTIRCVNHFATAAVIESGSGRNRTADTRIFSPLLYRLSY